MPSFQQQQLNYKVLNANAVTIMIGDIVVGFGQTSSPSTDFGTEQLYGIGSAKPQEIQQLKISPSVNIDSFQLSDSGLAFLGYPSSMLEVLANNSMDFHIMDATGVPILSYVGSVSSNFSLNIPANQPVTQTVSFLCMDVLNALGVSILNSNSALNVVAQAAIVGAGLNAAGL